MSAGGRLATVGRCLIVGVMHCLAAVFLVALGGPIAYDLQHGWGSAGDGYMLPFFLIPLCGPAIGLALWIDICELRRKRAWSWALWPVVTVLGLTLVAIVGFVILLVSELLLHKSAK